MDILMKVTHRGALHKGWPRALLCLALWVAALVLTAPCGLAQTAAQAAAPKAPATPLATQLATPPATSSATPPAFSSAKMLAAYDGQKVSSIELAGHPDLDDRELLPLLQQHAGEAFDSNKVERSVAAIRATGKFGDVQLNDVQLNVIPDVDGVRVLLILQPALYFGIYKFPGAKGFPYSRLLQVADYPPDGPYTRRDPANATTALLKFFQENGYFLAQVVPHLEPDPAHGIVNVRFDVSLGLRARFGSVTLEGASDAQAAFLQPRLLSMSARLRTAAIRAGKPYSLKTIQNATTYMQNLLVKQDRLGAQVKMIGAEYDPASNRANVHFHVTEGPLVRVTLTGAHVFKRTQHNLLPLYQQVGSDDELVEEGRKNLVSHFQSKGFFDAEVEADISHQGPEENVQYKISRSARHKVTSVSVEGNKALTSSSLLLHSAVKKAGFLGHGLYSDELLRTSSKNLEATYRAEGFSDVKVTHKVEGKGGDLRVTFLVAEGPRDVVRELKIVGNDTMTVGQLLPKGLKLAAGEPYSQSKADEDRRNITVKYLESGYLIASFRQVITSDKSDPHSLLVTYQISEGPRVTASSIVTLGRLHTRQTFIDRAGKFTLHAPVTTGEMLSAESRLYNPGIFDWAEVTPRRQITTQTAEDVLVKVHEAPRNVFTYGIGFEVIERGGSLPSGTVALPGLPPVGVTSNFATSEKTFWGPRGSAEYTRRNVFGMAESLSLATLDGRLLQRVTASFQDPSFHGTSFTSNLNGSFEHNSENPIFTDRLEQAGFQLQRSLDHKKQQRLYLRYSYSVTQITNLIIPQLILNSSDLNVRLSTLSATYSRDTRDNFLDATRGIYESVEADFNPQVLGSSVSFARILAQTATYRKLPHKVVWANSVRVGFDTAFAGSHVPLSQEFFSGGGSTLRGFPLDGAGPQRTIIACGNPAVATTCSPITVPDGGRQLFIANSEFRIPTPVIYKGVSVVAFYDGGNVFQAIGFHGRYTNSVGGGIRYATPVGPIRFDIGHNMNSPVGVASTNFFVTIGQAF